MDCLYDKHYTFVCLLLKILNMGCAEEGVVFLFCPPPPTPFQLFFTEFQQFSHGDTNSSTHILLADFLFDFRQSNQADEQFLYNHHVLNRNRLPQYMSINHFWANLTCTEQANKQTNAQAVRINTMQHYLHIAQGSVCLFTHHSSAILIKRFSFSLYKALQKLRLRHCPSWSNGIRVLVCGHFLGGCTQNMSLRHGATCVNVRPPMTLDS